MPPPVEKVIATGVQIVIGLTNDRQMQFQTGFEGDEPDAVVNARFDRIMRLADRQKARYEIGEIEDQLSKERDTLAQFREDLARVGLEHDRQQALRRVEIDERIKNRGEEKAKFVAEINGAILQMQEVRKDTLNEGLAEHQRSGRGGSYAPRGNVKVAITRIDKQIERATEHREEAIAGFEQDYADKIATAEAQIVKADAERDQAVANLNISIARYTDAIAEREARLARCRELAEG